MTPLARRRFLLALLALLPALAAALVLALLSPRAAVGGAGQPGGAGRMLENAGSGAVTVWRAGAGNSNGTGSGHGTATAMAAGTDTDAAAGTGARARAVTLARAGAREAAGSTAQAGVTVQLPPEPLRAAAGNIADLHLPRPGQYTLDRIMPVPHGAVLDSDGRARRLANYTTGKVTLLAFVYTTCSASRGCPLALTVMHSLRTAIESEPVLAAQLRFVSLSFDPRHDTPAVMRSYGGNAASLDAPLRWHFLTTQSERQLAPLLAGFGQDVSAVAAAGVTGDGAGAGSRAALAHLLKLYLIDQHGVVREIYSPAFLQPDTMLADMRSLLAEPGRVATSAGSARLMR